MNSQSSALQLSNLEQRQLVTPVVVQAVILCAMMIAFALGLPAPIESRLTNAGIALAGIVYTLFHYYILLPNFSTNRIVWWLVALINSAAIGLLLWLDPIQPWAFAFFLALLTTSGSVILTGRWPTYVFAVIISIAQWVLARPLFPWIDYVPLQYLVFPLAAAVITETAMLTRRSIARQVNRLELLSRVTGSLVSSLEIQEVIELVCNAIQQAMKADTYYVGLFRPPDSLYMALLYDEGEFFPKTTVSISNTLAGHVVRTAKPLHLNDVPREHQKLNLPLFIVGKPRTSLSWMGAPLISGGTVLGIIAVASYERNAFTKEDMDLLINLSNQAAMAIDNANHHEEVERRSRLDSLTGCLNHGVFIKALDEKIQECLKKNQPISVIMLDIDLFKKYNDMHGHLVGDQVLVMITETIRRHIKSTDLVGRWGGEEFVIALPNATGEEAVRVARRLQKSVGQIYLTDRSGTVISAPTISQGIAMCPLEASDAYSLIDLADQRLYRAKARGRNQVEPQENYWEEQLVSLPEQAHIRQP